MRQKDTLTYTHEEREWHSLAGINVMGIVTMLVKVTAIVVVNCNCSGDW